MTITWDINNQPDRDNIEAILAYMLRYDEIPLDAIDAIRGLLERAERTAAELAAAKQGEPADPDQAIQTVDMPKMTRQPHKRNVPLVENTFTCRICGKTQTILQYPGQMRRTCRPEDNPACRLTSRNERQQQRRDEKRQAQKKN